MANDTEGVNGSKTRLWQILSVVVVLAVISAGAFAVLGGEGDGGSAPTNATEPTTTTTTTTTPGAAGITDKEAATVVWPDPFGERRHSDPMAAVAGYAEDFIGFDSPVYGDFNQGDSRSGEVDVRATADGAVTTVLVRRMSDDNWYVLGSATENIELDDPAAGTVIDDPLPLTGRARAFEGTVQVSVFKRGSTRPLGEGFVTGSGDGTLGEFSDEVRWDDPGTGWGVVVLYTQSAEDGSVWEAMSIPVGFGGD